MYVDQTHADDVCVSLNAGDVAVGSSLSRLVLAQVGTVRRKRRNSASETITKLMTSYPNFRDVPRECVRGVR